MITIVGIQFAKIVAIQFNVFLQSQVTPYSYTLQYPQWYILDTHQKGKLNVCAPWQPPTSPSQLWSEHRSLLQTNHPRHTKEKGRSNPQSNLTTSAQEFRLKIISVSRLVFKITYVGVCNIFGIVSSNHPVVGRIQNQHTTGAHSSPARQQSVRSEQRRIADQYGELTFGFTTTRSKPATSLKEGQALRTFITAYDYSKCYRFSTPSPLLHPPFCPSRTLSLSLALLVPHTCTLQYPLKSPRTTLHHGRLQRLQGRIQPRIRK